MQLEPPPGAALARRLRLLRQTHWPAVRLTQRHIAQALGNASVPLISSWESEKSPILPPDHRLLAYATFFATERSVHNGQCRVLGDDELTEDEGTVRDGLYAELRELRDETPTAPVRIPLVGSDDLIGGGTWFFEDQKPVTIVCARLPDDLLARMPYTDPADPDYVRLYTYADLDSLIELYGHVRAINPANQVNFRSAGELSNDDLTAHVVLLGGVDWNPVTRDIIRRLALPVRQSGFQSEGPGFFTADEGGQPHDYRPVLDTYPHQVTGEETVTLREDVAHFYRGPNPYNDRRTLTLCNGMFGRGTYGAVRALTDARFRDRNEEFLSERFGGQRAFSILSRVLIVSREAVTPDWTNESMRLHEWSEPDA